MNRILIAGGLALSFGQALAQPAVETAPAPATATARVPSIASFGAPEEGFRALAAAIAGHDQAAMLRILGEPARRLINSGDATADRAQRDRFTAAYAAGHAVLRLADGRAILQVGEDGWPLPIPLLQRGGRWRFDARQGTQELIDRRVGRNELDTIETLRALGLAQAEFARTAGRQGGFSHYARRMFSSPGARDGLYWPSAEGEAPSPLGPLAAAASAGGYSRQRGADSPRAFNGYLFRILESQGPAAPGGAMDYLVNGQLLGGYAILAFPVHYGASGIKSFVISHHGQIWERDLGPNTAAAASAIASFDPGPGWSRLAE